MILQRRTFLTGLISFLAAPAIVRAENLMPVRSIILAPHDPLVRGVRWRSWPFGTPHPITDFAEGSIGVESGRGVAKPLSHFTKRLDWHKQMWPDLVWEPMQPLTSEHREKS